MSFQRTASWIGAGSAGFIRCLALAGAVATAVAFGTVSGPMPAASAAPPAYTTVNELAAAFHTATTGSVITLTQPLTGTADDDAVAVPAGVSMTLDLAGYSLTLVGAEDFAGLGVPATTSLTIENTSGTGSLAATGGSNGAGIGGGYLGAGGDVSIGVDASVTASSAAGIAIGPGPGSSASGLASLSNAGRLTIPSGNHIGVPAGVTVTNSGTIDVSGTLEVNGSIANSGIILKPGGISFPGNVTGHNFTIQLDQNSADGTVPADPAPVFAGSFQAGQVPFPAQATRLGHTFMGLYTAAVGGTEVSDTTDLGSGGPATLRLYAHWTVSHYTVTFDSQGASAVAPEVVDHNSPVVEPAAPTWAGLTFAGWYPVLTGATAWDFSTPITADMTLYAHWTPSHFAVPFDSQGGNAGTPALAETGSDPAGWPLAGAGLLLLGGGVAALTLMRRRRRWERG